MRYLLRWLAAPVFWLAWGLFRSSPGRHRLGKHKLVMRLFRFAADQGHRRGLSVYGHLLHFRGEGVQNRIQGAIYLERAATQGDPKASYQMGRIYEAGFEDYFQPEPGRALRFYQQAAQGGHPLAIKRMLQVSESGELGQPVDPQAATQWRQQLEAVTGAR